MNDDPLSSLSSYSAFLAALLNRPMVERSKIRVSSDSRYTAIAKGEVFFTNGYRLRMREELDFEDKRIMTYGYEVTREGEQLY